MFNREQIEELIAEEKQRFLTTDLAVVNVKRAPWSNRQRNFGSVVINHIKSGNRFCILTDDNEEWFDTIESFLEHWIGD